MDGAHGGSPRFFFLPPMVEQPAFSGTFDSTLLQDLAVEICDWGGSACAAPAVRFTSAGTGPERLRLGEEGGSSHYHVNWKVPSAPGVRRVHVLAAGTLLGFADVQVVKKGGELAGVDPTRFVGVVGGRTLPVRFRVEVGAVSVVHPGSGGTVTAEEGAVTLVVPPGATAGPVGITVSPVPPDSVPPDSTLVPGTVWELGPDGTEFASPVLLTLSYERALPGRSPSRHRPHHGRWHPAFRDPLPPRAPGRGRLDDRRPECRDRGRVGARDRCGGREGRGAGRGRHVHVRRRGGGPARG